MLMPLNTSQRKPCRCSKWPLRLVTIGKDDSTLRLAGTKCNQSVWLKDCWRDGDMDVHEEVHDDSQPQQALLSNCSGRSWAQGLVSSWLL